MQPQFHNEQQAHSALLGGSEKALKYFFDAYYSRLVYYASQILSDKQQAEEIVSDAFCKLWKMAHSIEKADKIKPLLYRMVRNASLDYLRVRKTAIKRKQTYTSLANPYEASHLQKLIEAETFHELHSLFSKLPLKAGQVFQLFYYKKMSYHQIAQQMDITPQTARNQKTRAVQLLKKYASSLSVYLMLAFSFQLLQHQSLF